MSDGESSNEAPISKEEWQHFRKVVSDAIGRATKSRGDVSAIPFIYKWGTEDGFRPYIQAWNNDKLKPNERVKGVSAQPDLEKVLVYTGEWNTNPNHLNRREYIDRTGKPGPWNAKLRDMVAQIERGPNDRRNRAPNLDRRPLISRAELRQREAEREAEQDRRARDALSDQKPQTTGCFIATVAFEDQDHPMVNELRFVRDVVLMYSNPGRCFVDWYYKNGPKMADFVVDKPSLKMAVRVLLTPVGQAVRLGRQIVSRWREIR